MQQPTNAAYGANDVPEDPAKKRKFLGMTFPETDSWKIGTVIGGVLLLYILVVLSIMPTGFSFLAAKNASGFFGYMGLFLLYMFGFLIILVLFFAIVVGILYAIQKSA